MADVNIQSNDTLGVSLGPPVAIDTQDRGFGSEDFGSSTFAGAASQIILGVESASSYIEFETSDELNVSTEDVASGFLVIEASDNLDISITDSTAPTTSAEVAWAEVEIPAPEEPNFFEKEATDTVSVALSDLASVVDPGGLQEVTANDVISVSITETVSNAVTLSASEVIGFSFTEQSNVLSEGETQVNISASDILGIFIGEGGSHGAPMPITASDTLGVWIADQPTVYKSFTFGPAPDDAVNEILGPATNVVRRVEIYESDGVTPWEPYFQPDFVDGIVNIDQARAERRTLDITLYNPDGVLKPNPDGFWYDKVIKVYRGVDAPSIYWETQIGEFMIDRIDDSHFPNLVKVTGRDYAKKMLLSKLPQATSFPANEPIEELIRTLALNAGVTKFNLPLTGANTQAEVTFDQNTDRWKVASDIAVAHGYDLFFTSNGMLTLQIFQDPISAPVVWNFQTGPIVGNLVQFSKSTNDSLLANHVVVTGETLQKTPVWGEAKNTDPNSPTSIIRIGSERTYFYESAFVNSFTQCEEIAERFLKIRALEQFEVSLTSIVFPWLDVGNIVQFSDPNPAPNDPTRYLLSSLSIPLSLAPMTGTVKRVRLVTA